MNQSAVHLSLQLSRSAAQGVDGVRLILQVELTADQALANRAPLNVSFVLDRSGSMAGDKIKLCKTAVAFALSQMSAGDAASVVVFDDRVEVVAPHEKAATRAQAIAAVQKVETRGSTNLSGGWLQGADMVERGTAEGVVSRVVLLTDGQANVGVVAHDQLCTIAQGLFAKGVATTTIGLGSDFNEDLLRGMADAGGGNFHYAASAEEAPPIFAQEFQELLSMAAQNVRVVVTPTTPARLLRCLQDFPTQATAEGLEVRLGDLTCGNSLTLLLEFFLPAHAQTRNLAVLQVAYQQIVGEVAFKEFNSFVDLPADGADHLTLNPFVWRQVLLTDVARAMQAAQSEADQGKLAEARQRVEETQKAISEGEYRDDPIFQEQILRLEKMRSMLRDSATYKIVGRKFMSTSSVVLSRLKGIQNAGFMPMHVRFPLLNSDSIVFLVASDLVMPDEVSAAFEGGHVDGPEVRRAWQWIVTQQATFPSASTRALRHLAALVRRWQETIVLTTSVEDLARTVDPMPVFELGGNIFKARCLVDDGVVVPMSAISAWQDDIPMGTCGHPLVPDLLWPRQDVPENRLTQAAAYLKGADCIILLGSMDARLQAILEGATRDLPRPRVMAFAPLLLAGEIDWQHPTSVEEGLRILAKDVDIPLTD